MNSMELRCDLEDEQATLAFGAALACALPTSRPCVIWLRGDLGAGKTTLARGAIQHFDPGARVKSPTYALIETYALHDFTLHHLDLYRVRDPSELEALGLREFADDLLLIEWPERGGGATPVADIELLLRHTDSGQRHLEAVAPAVYGEQILSELQQVLQRTGYE
ncbi:MAG: tRNA (adenosine(37)-N6)-threonylcarbamoyltransferase complex ATPase subunit type 1 TsaE [Lysobacterales bacterium]